MLASTSSQHVESDSRLLGNPIRFNQVENRSNRGRVKAGRISMCRNIRTLFNFDPPATEEEIRASALQFVGKLSGFNAPSKANEAAFRQAVDEVAGAARRLLVSLKTEVQPRDRAIEATKARARSQRRFSKPWPAPSSPTR
jgi:hypothetical protein